MRPGRVYHKMDSILTPETRESSLVRVESAGSALVPRLSPPYRALQALLRRCDLAALTFHVVIKEVQCRFSHGYRVSQAARACSLFPDVLPSYPPGRWIGKRMSIAHDGLSCRTIAASNS